MKERITVRLPEHAAKELRRLAAEMHAPVSSLVAMAVEQFLERREVIEAVMRAELFARVAALGVARQIKPGDARSVVLDLVGEAQEQMKRMRAREKEVKARRDGTAGGDPQGRDGLAGTQDV